MREPSEETGCTVGVKAQRRQRRTDAQRRGRRRRSAQGRQRLGQCGGEASGRVALQRGEPCRGRADLRLQLLRTMMVNKYYKQYTAL